MCLLNSGLTAETIGQLPLGTFDRDALGLVAFLVDEISNELIEFIVSYRRKNLQRDFKRL